MYKNLIHLKSIQESSKYRVVVNVESPMDKSDQFMLTGIGLAASADKRRIASSRSFQKHLLLHSERCGHCAMTHYSLLQYLTNAGESQASLGVLRQMHPLR